jgi:citrate lyase subunit beta/citryl-CoA lyase
VEEKDDARQNIVALTARPAGMLAVRVNAVGTPWSAADVSSCVGNPAVDSIVVPKVEDPNTLVELAKRLDDLEAASGRRTPLSVQALVESPAGVHRAASIATATDRLCALIIGYADLSASLGRRIEASWQFAQDALLLAARMAGVQAIDGPLLTVAADEALERAATQAEGLRRQMGYPPSPGGARATCLHAVRPGGRRGARDT